MKKQKIKAVRNIWGNYGCFVGAQRVETYGDEFDAQRWLNEKMETGQYEVSDKSELKPTSSAA